MPLSTRDGRDLKSSSMLLVPLVEINNLYFGLNQIPSFMWTKTVTPGGGTPLNILSLY